jgi:EAL domain-containing protein (putative c-di-GMP-specific phosphodiesterase class I)
MTALSEIISRETIQSHFQPIVSVRQCRVMGAEALARAECGDPGLPVSPSTLFQWAAGEGRLVDLDRLCRRKAVRAFQEMRTARSSLLLFVNLEASLLDLALRRGNFLSSVARAGLQPRNVVIEINESEVIDTHALSDFVSRYRAQGFLIAMDDLGSGHSNLDRWCQVRPDIVKIDRALVHGVATSAERLARLRSIVALGRHLGTRLVAEGLEDANDVDLCLDEGVDLFQGYYFGRPTSPERWSPEDAIQIAEECARRRMVRRGGRRP